VTEPTVPLIKGWRAEVGIVAPYTGLYREFETLLPSGVKISQVVVGMHGVDAESIKKMTELVEVEAKKLTFSHRDDLLCFACTAGSFIGGLGWDKMLIDKIEKATGIPATTTTTCVMELFKDMGIKKIALVGPYLKELFDAEVNFLEGSGIKVLTVNGLGFSKMSEYWDYYTNPYATYKIIKDGIKVAPDADCVFVTCMLSSITAIVDTVEREIGRPVISSCSATMYGILKKLGIPDPVYHYGEALVRRRI
jgi:maleate cis-trans isomerase